jgi:hypothetical protein
MPDGAFQPQPVGSVPVVAGRDLKELFEGIGNCGVEAEAIDAAWATLREHVEQRDARGLRLAARSPVLSSRT